jgi:Uma2 family endonuclease
LLNTWLGLYELSTPGCEVLANTTWFLLDSSPQPDIALSWLPRGTISIHSDEDFPVGRPDLVVEVCRSSRSYDLGPKLALYQKARVPEYLAVLIEEKRIEWRSLKGDRYQLITPDHDGFLKSRIFPGLWLDPNALLAMDRGGILAAGKRGLENREDRAGG